MESKTTSNNLLVENLIALINKAIAHVTLEESLKNIPFELLDKTTPGLPYNLWQLAEHIRIAQSDILEFSRNPKYESPQWPEGYWPETSKPSSEKEWDKCVLQIRKDREAFIGLLQDSSEHLLKPFEHGKGQSLLREALVFADHNSYHTGEIVLLRRLLGVWKK